MNTQRIQSLFSGAHVGQTLTLQGWVRTFRANRFIAINDGSTLSNLQCVVDFEQTDEAVLKSLATPIPTNTPFNRKNTALNF
jgi:asparaginyl-tRNA synthetase